MKSLEVNIKYPFASLPFYEGVASAALPPEGATGYPLAGVPVIVFRKVI